MNKCEWRARQIRNKPAAWIFDPCELLVEFESLTIEAIKNKMSRYNFCPFCGADIRKPKPKQLMTCDSECGLRMKYGVSCEAHDCKMIRPVEPAKPLIVKSGETWVAYWNRIDYLWTGGNFLKTIEPPFSMITPKYGQWKSFTGPDPDITELTDEIAKLRPMVRMTETNNMSKIYKLIFSSNRESVAVCNEERAGLYWKGIDQIRLATTKELQETS